MSLIETTLFGRTDKVKTAIERIRTFDPISSGIMDDPYYVAYSGGKDSDVLRILFALSGVKHDLVHNHTTVDAPETVYYVRSIPHIQISMPELTMWRLIVRKHIPPTRRIRYCCEFLKERGGQNRFVSTGVRWSESPRRKLQRGSVEIQTKKAQGKMILNADNTESRRIIETCQMRGKHILNPIIDWKDDDVWEFLNHYGCKSNPLYQCGFSRIGCVGCPMAGRKGMLFEFERYPKYMENYIKAFERMVKKRKQNGMDTIWENGQQVFDWWIREKPKMDEMQMRFY